jgi:hypothetical protein
MGKKTLAIYQDRLWTAVRNLRKDGVVWCGVPFRFLRLFLSFRLSFLVFGTQVDSNGRPVLWNWASYHVDNMEHPQVRAKSLPSDKTIK